MKIRKGDVVKILSGRDKGKQGKVYKVDPKELLVWVEGMNTVKRHQKPTQKNKQGGIIEKEKPLHVCKVMYLDEKLNKPTRLSYRYEKNGNKVRVCKKSGDIAEVKL